jgi:hypothetical protein
MFPINRYALIAAVVAGLLTTQPAYSQEFTDPEGKFKLSLVSDWRAVTYNDAVGRSKTEFVYRDRSEGLLKVNKEGLGGRSLSDIVQEEEQNFRLYRSGFEMAGKEAFGGGGLRGMRLSFNYVEGGRRMAGTFYYLQEGDTVWVLKFVGKRGTLDTIRNVTDQIARSFKPV